MLIVGYNDQDANPDNHYWIVLNSWGTSGGARPNGLFRMKMHMNYDCTYFDGGNEYSSMQFQTLDTSFINTNRLYMAVKGASSNSIYVRSQTGGIWSNWAPISGQTTHAPAMAVFNSRLYLAVKGASNPGIYVRSKDYQTPDNWGPWVALSGATSTSPALVVYHNRLYLFVKGNTTGTIYYKSMDTSGNWSTSWATVPGSSTYPTIDTPAVVVYDDLLTLFQTGPNGRIYLTSMRSDGVWTGWYYFYGGDFEMQTTAGPAATVFNNNIWLFVKGQFGSPWSNSISYNIFAGGGMGWTGWTQLAGSTSTTPSVTAGPKANQIYVAVKGNSSNAMYYRFYDTIEQKWIPEMTWSPAVGSTSDTPIMNTYYFGGP